MCFSNGFWVLTNPAKCIIYFDHFELQIKKTFLPIKNGILPLIMYFSVHIKSGREISINSNIGIIGIIGQFASMRLTLL